MGPIYEIRLAVVEIRGGRRKRIRFGLASREASQTVIMINLLALTEKVRPKTHHAGHLC